MKRAPQTGQPWSRQDSQRPPSSPAVAVQRAMGDTRAGCTPFCHPQCHKTTLCGGRGSVGWGQTQGRVSSLVVCPWLSPCTSMALGISWQAGLMLTAQHQAPYSRLQALTPNQQQPCGTSWASQNTGDTEEAGVGVQTPWDPTLPGISSVPATHGRHCRNRLRYSVCCTKHGHLTRHKREDGEGGEKTCFYVSWMSQAGG